MGPSVRCACPRGGGTGSTDSTSSSKTRPEVTDLADDDREERREDNGDECRELSGDSARGCGFAAAGADVVAALIDAGGVAAFTTSRPFALATCESTGEGDREWERLDPGEMDDFRGALAEGFAVGFGGGDSGFLLCTVVMTLLSCESRRAAVPRASDDADA